MAKQKPVSRSKLNTLMQTLPTPIEAHCVRCKKLASYILERAVTEDWFIDSGINVEHAISAVYYHDIGKAGIIPDALYSEGCRNSEEINEYRTHVERGIELINTALSVDLFKYGKRTFEKYLLYCIAQHHEAFDGSGFPSQVKGGDIHIVARLTAVVNAFDNALFSVKNTKCDFESAVAAVRLKSGNVLDPDIVDCLLSDTETLSLFAENLLGREHKKFDGNFYGLHLRFIPLCKKSSDDKPFIWSYHVDTFINDPYYGIVKSNAYIPVANSNSQIFSFEKLAFEKLCKSVKSLIDKDIYIPDFSFCLSYREFETDDVYSWLLKCIEKYSVPAEKFCICINEADIVDFHLDIKKISSALHEIGFNFGISEFGSGGSLISSLSDVQTERVLMHSTCIRDVSDSDRTFRVVSGMADILNKLDITTVYLNVDSEKEYDFVEKLGGNSFGGNLFAVAFDETKLTSFFSKGGGID